MGPWKLAHHTNAKLEAGSEGVLSRRPADQPKSGVTCGGTCAQASNADPSFTARGERHRQHDSRDHAGSLPRALWHDARGPAFGSAGRFGPRSDHLSLEPSAGSNLRSEEHTSEL